MVQTLRRALYGGFVGSDDLIFHRASVLLHSSIAPPYALSNVPFVIAGFGAGIIFASIAFAISVVSVPLMLGRADRGAHRCEPARADLSIELLRQP